MKKIKVMHVLCMGSFSGAENVAITLINSLKDEVDSVYVSPTGSIHDVLAENEIKHYIVDKVSVGSIRKAIKDEKPDIIHAHDFTAGIVSAMSTIKIPIVNHLHNNSLWIKKLCVKSIAYGLSGFRYKKILTVSDAVMDEYIFGQALKKKTEVVGNPINLQVIRDKAEEAELKDISDIVFLGRLSEPKNPVFFVEIVNELVKRIPDLKVSVIGDGELREAVEQKISEFGLEKNIRLWGFQKNPYGLVKNAKLMCMPSLWEGFGLAAVEALGLGKPVVATPVGGLKNIVTEECGSLCESKEEFTETIYKLLSDYTILEKKIKAARERADVYDNIAKYKKQIYEVYKKLS